MLEKLRTKGDVEGKSDKEEMRQAIFSYTQKRKENAKKLRE